MGEIGKKNGGRKDGTTEDAPRRRWTRLLRGNGRGEASRRAPIVNETALKTVEVVKVGATAKLGEAAGVLRLDFLRVSLKRGVEVGGG